MAGESDVEIVIRAKNLSAEAFAQVLSSLGDVKAQTEQTGTVATKAGEAANKAHRNAKGGVDAHKQSVSEIVKEWINGSLGLNKLNDALVNHVGLSNSSASAITGMVQAAGPAAFAIAGIAVAVIGTTVAAAALVEHAMSTGHALEKMSAQSGMSAEGLSELGGAARLVEEDLGAVMAASFQMQRRLGDDSKSFAQGLAKIGLSLKDVKGQNPEEMFLTISRGMRETTDSATRLSAANDLMGRGGREAMFLMMQPLEQFIQEARDAGVVMSETDVAAADKLEHALNRLKLQFEGLKITIGTDLIYALNAFGHMKPLELLDTLTIGSMTGSTGMIEALAQKEKAYQAGLDATNQHLKERDRNIKELGASEKTLALEQSLGAASLTIQGNKLADLNPKLRAWVENQLYAGHSTEDVTAALAEQGQASAITEAQLKVLDDRVKEQKKSNEEYAKALAEVNAAQKTVSDTNKDALDRYIEVHDGQAKYIAGTESISKVTGIASVIIQRYLEDINRNNRGVKDAAKAEADWRKELEDTAAKYAEERQKIAQAHNESMVATLEADKSMREKLTESQLKGTDLAIYQIDREQQAFIASLGVRDVYNAASWDDAAKVAAVYYDRQRYQLTHLVIDWRDAYDSIRKTVSIGLSQMLTGVTGFKESFVNIWRGLRSAVGNVLNEILDYFINSFLKGIRLAMSGQSFSSAFSGMTMAGLSGTIPSSQSWGAGVGVSSAPTWGSLAPAGGPTGTTAAGHSSMLTYAGPVAGAMVGGLAGYSVGYGTGNSFAGAAVGAGAGAATGAAVGAIFAPETLGLSIAVGALVGAVAGLYGAYKYHKEQRKLDREADVKIQDRYNELLKTYGGKEQLQQLGSLVGLDVASGDQNRKREGLAMFTAEADAFEARLKILQDAIAKYGLSMADMGPAMAAATLKTSATALLADYQVLTKAGADTSTVIDKMAPAFNDMIAAALKGGQKVPAAFAPILKQLVEMGKLTDENRRKLLGLGDSVDVEALAGLAQKYGIDEGALGQGYQQTKAGRSAEEMVADFNTLIGAGADRGGVLLGMKEEIGAVVANALKYGLELPETFKPLVEGLAQIGGNGLPDISKLQWAAPLAASMDTLTDAILALVAAIENPAGGRVDAEGNPIGPSDDRLNRLDNRNYPGLADSGYVEQTGLARIHAGEWVGTLDAWAKAQAKAGGGGRGPTTIVLQNYIGGTKVGETIYEVLADTFLRKGVVKVS